MIPAENVEDLMLREDVVDAVAVGKFHIHPVASIEQGIEILTGVAAGQRGSDSRFEPHTCFALVDARLRDMAQTLKEYQS
jgi:predicted ATP-dependent protease